MFYLLTKQAHTAGGLTEHPVAHVDVDLSEGPSTGYTFTANEAKMLIYFNKASAKYPVDRYKLKWMASLMNGNGWYVVPR